ncbi:ribosome biogenesis GTP-binding protein YihA/YsxC [Desulfuromonas carbonis]|uniref:ribosome biogenesis GTP-binding protein YihA/YsxC n=1 Tax=Desulfuromonas sp. DDH964 TaxID=1823759 RepID=UPI00078CC8CB|nr:ribosome biogenesis GTP-binding protein YihA/YsxC [Desulfuromonas sp. DDH964]AMV73416.1 GTP-binding protein YsxC [Desulfuromonas sp. DDH964]
MQIKSTEFLKSCTAPGHYPEALWPEIAFAGRSNVGKSSLINTLLNRRALVRTSSTPGRTQLLNFFLVNGELGLVDLPGYGFAKVPMAVRKDWGPMVRTYLETRSCLRAVVLLFDVRRVPYGEDLQLLDWLEEFGVPTIPVITKVDKISRGQRARQLAPIFAATGLPADAFTLFSAKTREGRDEIWQRLGVALEEAGKE